LPLKRRCREIINAKRKLKRHTEVRDQASGLIWCRIVDIGAHLACGPLLQALFMTSKALPTWSTVTVRSINIELFIAASPQWASTLPTRSFFVQNELDMNAQSG
jgi:hypothetical protein